MQDNCRVVVIGAGTMGTNLARLMLRQGMAVTVLDIDAAGLERCRAALQADLPDDAPVSFIRDAAKVGPCDVVLESVTEDMTLKRKVLSEIEQHVADDTLILTNTSGLSIQTLSKALNHPERFLGAHFFNPADLIPAVEVIPGKLTSEPYVEQAAEWLRQLGKRPAILRKEVPGFVANRIQHALMRECLALLEQGVVDADALDDIVRYSIGIRLAINGPLRQRDLNGLDTHLNIARYLYADLESRTSPGPLLESLVAEGRLGRKSGHGFHEWPKEAAHEQQQDERRVLERLLALVEGEGD